MPVVFVHGIRTMCGTISFVAHLKNRIVEAKAEENRLALALIIAIARVVYDSNYKSYRDGWRYFL